MPIIRVNLLPPEKRRRERTPLSRFVALVVGTAVNAAIVAFMVKLALDTRGTRQTIESTDKTIRNLTLSVLPEYEKVKKEKDKIEARKIAIDALRKERTIVWSKVLDNVWDVVHANQWVWFTGLTAGEGTPKGAKTNTPLDLYVVLNCNGSANEDDCRKNHVAEVQTKFKNDLWEKFKVVPGTPLDPNREFPFDAADESVIVNRHDDSGHRESVYLDYVTVIGRKAQAAKAGLPTKPH